MSAAVVATAFGGPEVLSVVDVPLRAPGPDEVRVSVRAAGVNPIDHKSYSGAFGTDPAQLPKPVGFEASGVVDAVGRDVSGLAIGDEVIACGPAGAYAESYLLAATDVLPKPPNLPWDEAAGLLLTGATAVHVLTVARVAEGDTVLVHGGSGGVGLMVLQLAAARGATVIATGSPSKNDLIAGFGATPVAYGDGLLDRIRAIAPNGVTVALDLVGTDEAIDVSLALVTDRSRIVTIAAFGRGQEAGIALLGGGPGADPGTEIRRAARAQLVEAARAGELRTVVGATFPLEQAAEAHRVSRAGHATGKIVLTVST